MTTKYFLVLLKSQKIQEIDSELSIFLGYDPSELENASIFQIFPKNSNLNDILKFNKEKKVFKDVFIQLIDKNSKLHSFIAHGISIKKNIFISFKISNKTNISKPSKTSIFNTPKTFLKLEALFNNLSEGIGIFNNKLEFIHINSSFTQITGYSISDIEKKSISILANSKKTLQKLQKMESLLQKEDRGEIDFVELSKNGDLYYAHLTLVALPYSNIDIDEKLSPEKVPTYMGIIKNLTENKKIKQTIWYKDNYDSLTNLPNRNFYVKTVKNLISNCIKENTPVALFILDLDNFKSINDRFGHTEGDQILIQVANLLGSFLSGNQLFARLGGDEFALIIPDFKNKLELENFSKNLLQKLNRPFSLKSRQVEITASLGIATFPKDAQSAETLFQNADVAMYQAKHKGKNRIQFFSGKLRDSNMHSAEMKRYLRKAIDKNEMKVLFQPQICLKTMTVMGAEALLRWKHPRFGLLSPDSFLYLADQNDIIETIDDWVIHQVIAACKKQKNQPKVRFSFNLSPKKISNQNFIFKLIKWIKESNLETELFEIEVTESYLMNDIDVATKMIYLLRDNGIRIAIDDFGTGYSSLSLMNKLPLDLLKIDKSFVQNLQNTKDTKIISAIIDLAQNLGLETVAEGIETSNQLKFLKHKNVDLGQGFYFSPPIKIEDFISFKNDSSKNKTFKFP